MISILFVDDEIAVLDTIRDSLRDKQNIWNIDYADSAESALNCLAAKQFDIIVSDMKMPEMDGATLLAKVQEIYPEIVRFVLAEQKDEESFLRVLPVVHQFIQKPINSFDLVNFLDRAAQIKSRIQSQDVLRLVASVKTIPSRPKTALRISVLLGTGEYTIKDLRCLVDEDLGLCTRVIQVANSAFVGRSKEVTDVGDAISLLGASFIQALAFANDVFSITPENRHLLPLIEKTYDNALYGSMWVSRFLRGKHNTEFAKTATLLRDIGVIVTASSSRDVCDHYMRSKKVDDEKISELELRILKATHAELGGHLLALWGLPMSIVDGVTCHHSIESSTLDPNTIAAIHIADIAADFQGKSKETLAAAINWKYMQDHGLDDLANEWIDMVALKSEGAA